MFDAYLLALRQTSLDQHTEMTGRSALEALLNGFKPPRATVTHEPKRAQDKGAPDFKISQSGQILGYVEVKQVGENLDAVMKSAQIKKYQTLSGNIVVTDYLRFIWLRDGKIIADERLGEARLLEDRKAQLRPDKVPPVEALLRNFFSQPVTGISRAKPLAEALATRSQLLRDHLGEELVRQNDAKEGGQLIGLFGAFQRQVSHEITLPEFADAFAQTLAYGLFLAKLNDGADATITLANAKTFVPQSVGLIRELVGFLDNLDRDEYGEIKWVVEEILSIINGLRLTELQEDLSFRNRSAKRGTRAGSDEEWRLFSRDPFIYFYEDYLAKYDAKLRKSRGVYYTPPPIVNFIVRAVHDILKETFGIEAGLADRERVTVLDFACGTGTFLVEVLERIFEEIGPDSGKAGAIVSDHILKNIFGFEYLIAPYTIAHLKLGQYLADKGYKLKPNERFQAVLTNTLEPIGDQYNYFVPALSRESRLAQDIKQMEVLVITGNPPYSANSKNNGPRAKESIRKYKHVLADFSDRQSGLPLDERNSKWLQDDYVKFIAFAQNKIDQNKDGLVAIITNHGFLENPTFRGLRQSLRNSFEQMYFIDLHGNRKRGERAPDGSVDENVFDIEQGVAISILVKSPGAQRFIRRHDVWGKRDDKYHWAAEANISVLDWDDVNPVAPHYLFKKANAARQIYQSYQSANDIFAVGGVGLMTARDGLTIHFNDEELNQVTQSFVQLPPELAREAFKLGPDVRDWKVEWAQADVQQMNVVGGGSQAIHYRPFDLRKTLYSGRSRGFHCYPRDEIMGHMRWPNIALLTGRSNKMPFPDHFLVSQFISEAKTAESSTQSSHYPLYRYSEHSKRSTRKSDLFGDGHDPFAGKDRIENISPAFRRWLDERLGGEPATPEAVLGYIYAVLHAPAYRARYADFLRTDFPRIPFPEDRADFDSLSALGWALVEAHLLRAVPKRGLGGYRGKGDNVVAGKVRYSPAERAVWINDINHFTDVPQAVWDFTIGGYQVIDKYLKSRKGRTLSLDEIENVERVVNVLDFTIEQMARIDAVYVGVFPG